MAYKVQLGAAHLEGLLSGSSTVSSVGSLSSSGDLAVTGAVHAANLYGNGSGLTNISADGIDVTSSTGDIAYAMVFTQGFQTDGTLGLGGNTALNFNPNDGILSSSAGLRLVSAAVLGGALNVSGAVTFANTASLSDINMTGALSASSTGVFGSSISSSGDLAVTGNVHAAAYYGDGANLTNVGVSGSTRHYSTTGFETSGYLKVSGSTTLAGTGSMSDINMSGALSGSGDLLFQGGANLGSTLNVTGAISGANLSGEAGTLTSLNLQVGGITNAGAVAGGTTATFSSTISGSGIQGEAGVLTSLNLQVGGITNAGALAGVTTATLSGLLSSSAGAQVVGNTIFGGQLAVSGGAQYKVTTITTNTHLTASTATMYQVVSGGTAAITVRLPSASVGANYQYAVKRHGLMSGNVVVTGSDLGDVIDGNASLTLATVGASVFLISDGTQWNIF